MPDALAILPDWPHPELIRTNKARHAAADARWEGRMVDARRWDALAERIIAAMKRGDKPPLFDLTSPYLG